jgi:ribosomal-protein-alanine N-acetyltransferase
VGEPVFIRHPRAGDEAEFVALRRTSRAFLEPWEPIPPAGTDGFDGVAFARMLAASDTERSQRFLVCREEDGRIVGQASLGEIIRGSLEQAFLGYWVGAPHARKGYMTSAIRLVLGRAFGPLGLHRVEANIQPQNAPSIALARRVGMRKEGFSPRYLAIRGAWTDHERWAITAEEWPPNGRLPSG